MPGQWVRHRSLSRATTAAGVARPSPRRPRRNGVVVVCQLWPLQCRRDGGRSARRHCRAGRTSPNCSDIKAFTSRHEPSARGWAGVSRLPAMITTAARAGWSDRDGGGRPSNWQTSNSKRPLGQFSHGLAVVGKVLSERRKKLSPAQSLFGFSQHKMLFCDLRLRNCQTSNTPTLQLS